MKKQSIRVVSQGIRLSSNDKRHLALQRIDDRDNFIGNGWLFTPKKVVCSTVGGIYTIDAEIKEDGVSIEFGSARYAGQFGATALVGQWSIESKAAETELAAIAQAKKAKRDDSAALSCLAPLLKVYHNTNAVGRLALEVRVLHYLRTAGSDISGF